MLIGKGPVWFESSVVFVAFSVPFKLVQCTSTALPCLYLDSVQKKNKTNRERRQNLNNYSNTWRDVVRCTQERPDGLTL